MKSLIIIKPSALAKKSFGLIISRIEKENVSIVSMKTTGFDIHLFKKKLNEEQNEEKKIQMQNAKKIPCVLIIIQGENAVNVGQNLKKEFNDLIHSSLNEETAKYEINRFFEKEEVFENEASDGSYFLNKLSKKEIASKSIRELTGKNILGIYN